MRIISGLYKGRRITAPSVLPVRPTTDAAKESLFNILSNSFSFDQISFLDLFTGTGNISYEMASRGCTDISAVDIDYRCTGFVKATASNLGMEGLLAVKRDVYQYLREVSRSYDIIFADPPYKHGETALIHKLVFERGLLEEDGCLILEHGEDQDFSSLAHLHDERRIGNVNFTIFKR
ncbi:MAG: RsmD family RNA methyltransferase [Flavobacteriales bacterium]|nr:RsmD family RNA methyltransferase [Flavobacteriales bacterium]